LGFCKINIKFYKFVSFLTQYSVKQYEKIDLFFIYKQAHKMKAPTDLLFTNEHLWVQQTPDGDWLAGITDYAQDLLGDIVYLDPPKANDTLVNGQACGIVESVKTGSDLHAPMNGTVTAINEDLINMPEGINDNPYKAWIFKFKPLDEKDTQHFMNAAAYEQLIANL
jgi:glycine cleavage system H protein